MLKLKQYQAEENLVTNIGNMIKEGSFYNPLPLLLLPLVKQEYIGNMLLPYSIGIEFESDDSISRETLQKLLQVPYCIENKSTQYEYRFRIPSGVKGLVCLFLITETLKIYTKETSNGGIHYHVDCSDVISFKDFVDSINPEKKTYILKELDTWNYKGSYNTRGIGTGPYWIRTQPSFKTFEFRIGEMTYNYSLLLKRIIHASKLVRFLKSDIFCKIPDDLTYNSTEILETADNYLGKLETVIVDHSYNILKDKIEELGKDVIIEKQTELNKATEEIGNRIIKI